MYVLGQLRKVHVLQYLNEGGPGGRLKSLAVQPSSHHLQITGVHPWEMGGGRMKISDREDKWNRSDT